MKKAYLGGFAGFFIVVSMIILGILVFVFADRVEAANITRVFNCTGPDCSRLIAKPNDFLDMGEGTESKPCVASSGAPATSCTGGSCSFDPGTGTLYFCGDSGSWSPISGGGGSTAPYDVANLFGPLQMWHTAEEDGGGLWTEDGPLYLFSQGIDSLGVGLTLINTLGDMALQSAENIQLVTKPVGDGSVVQVAGVIQLQFQDSIWDLTSASSAADPGFDVTSLTKENLADPEFIAALSAGRGDLRNVPIVAGLLDWGSTITVEGGGSPSPQLVNFHGKMNLDYPGAWLGARLIGFFPQVHIGSQIPAGYQVSLGLSTFQSQPNIVNEYPTANPYIVEGFGTFVDSTNWSGLDWGPGSLHNSFRSSPNHTASVGRATAFSCGGATGAGSALGGRYCLTAMEWSPTQLANGYEVGVSLQAGMDIGIKNGSPLVEPEVAVSILGTGPLTITGPNMWVIQAQGGGVRFVTIAPGIDGQTAEIMGGGGGNPLFFQDQRVSGSQSNFIAASCGTPNGGSPMCSGGSPSGGGCFLQAFDSIQIRYSGRGNGGDGAWIQTGCAQIQAGYPVPVTVSGDDGEAAAE